MKRIQRTTIIQCSHSVQGKIERSQSITFLVYSRNVLSSIILGWCEYFILKLVFCFILWCFLFFVFNTHPRTCSLTLEGEKGNKGKSAWVHVWVHTHERERGETSMWDFNSCSSSGLVTKLLPTQVFMRIKHIIVHFQSVRKYVIR